MNIQRNLMDGIVDTGIPKDTNALILNQVNIANSPRAFQVKALPSDEVVYWSFSRRKVNNYIKNLININDFDVVYGETVQGKSLSYNFRYSPNEYIFGVLIYVVSGVILVLSKTPDKIFIALLILLSVFCFWQGMKSKKSYNK